MKKRSLGNSKSQSLDSSHLRLDWQDKITRAGKATISAQAACLVLNIISMAILARILTPADFGLIAMTTAVTGVVTIFKDGGLSTATIQRENISHTQVSNLFWINVLLSLLLALIIALTAPAIAWFYGDARIKGITLAIAAVFFISGIAVQHQALLQREMCFTQIAKLRVISMVFGIASAIITAFAGFGYWALVIQIATSEVATATLSWWYCRWLPSKPKLGQGTLSMLRVGGHVTVLGFFNFLGRNADNVLVGHAWGSQAVGSYSKAYGLLMLPIQQISAPIASVAMPALSRLQNNPSEFRSFFRKTLTLLCLTSFPVIAWIIICRNEIVHVLLGYKWLDAAPIFLALSLSAFCQPVGNISSLLYLSLGRTSRMLRWGIIGNIWIVAGILIGLPWGVKGIALGYSFSILLMMFPLMKYSVSGTCVKLEDYLKPLFLPVFATLGSGLIGWIVHYFIITNTLSIFTLVFTGLSILLSYLIIVYKRSPELLLTLVQILFRGS